MSELLSSMSLPDSEKKAMKALIGVRSLLN